MFKEFGCGFVAARCSAGAGRGPRLGRRRQSPLEGKAAPKISLDLEPPHLFAAAEIQEMEGEKSCLADHSFTGVQITN